MNDNLGVSIRTSIRDLGDTKLYVAEKVADDPALRSRIAGNSNFEHPRAHWDDLLLLAASI